MTRCKHCGNHITYEPPTDKFLGGWCGEDGWGIVCAVQTYESDTLHHEPEREHSNGWACSDCLMLLANGETPVEMSEEETEEYESRVDHYCAGTEVTLGRMFGEDGCEHTSEQWHAAGELQEEHAVQCEQQEFSWSQCDTCGSRLGGSRDAVTFWLTAVA